MADVLKPVPPPEKKPGDAPPTDGTTAPPQATKGTEDDLSDEDKALLAELDLLIERLKEENAELYDAALENLRSHIKASTTSMTSVPKPLKFLRKHYPALKEIYEKMEGEAKKKCADIISVLGMTISTSRECLKYKLLGVNEEIGDWGHEYVRHLAGEISQEWWESKELSDTEKEQLLDLARKIIPYNLHHNAEGEACDLAMELEKLELLEEYVEEDPHQRVCAYLTSCVAYVPDPENSKLLRTAYNVYKKFEQWPQALRVAMQLNKIEDIKDLVEKCPDEVMRKQLAFMIGRQQLNVEFPESQAALTDIVTNTLLNVNFLSLGRELDILEPKTPDEVYKTHLDGNRSAFGSQVDSARQNLASSFVSGFVNAGFGRDKLLTEDGNKWLYKNKEHGMLSAAASLGLILLWDVDGGLSQIDKYLYSAEDYIKAGALLACGIVNCGVRSECDPALALLTDYVVHQSPIIRTGSILGLGLAYAGTNREDVLKILYSAASDATPGLEVLGISCLSVGLIAVGTCNEIVSSLIVQCLMERTDEEWRDPYIRFCCLGLGLCVLGRQEEAEAICLALEVLPENFRNLVITIVESCAYAGTGNVLKIQKLLHICSEHYEPPVEPKKEEEKTKKPKDKSKKETKDSASDKAHYEYLLKQSAATLGIALIAMGEDIGTEMAFRTFGHLLRYGEPPIRKAVPLALGLLSVSNPRLTVLDTLSKFSHDLDSEVALNSIFSMGIVGAGTNNARVAAMLRQLSQYHAKDSNHLFMVRIAQGLVHLGKGTLGLSPFHSDRQLLSPVAMGGLLCTIFSFLDVRGTILGKGHYMLYCLAPAMNPRMLATFDENLEQLPVPVRVGQAVDTVGVAGKPKTITGFQTYTTPVLLGHGERAELATDDYIALSPILEGFVILRKNPAAGN